MGNVVPVKTNALIGGDELKVLRDSLFRGFTDAEVNYSVAICNQLQLNPLLKQIHFVKRNTKNGPVITAQTGIDGFRLTAERTGAYAGSDEPIYEYDAKDKKRPLKATVTVYKMMQGQRCAFTASARWDEYYQATGGQWEKMPHVMLSKCAEALALRKAFPAELSALRSDEEMQQADGPSKADTVQKKVLAEEPKDIETTAAVVEPESESEQEPQQEFDEPMPICSLCNAEMKQSNFDKGFYCPNYKDKRNHDRIRA